MHTPTMPEHATRVRDPARALRVQGDAHAGPSTAREGEGDQPQAGGDRDQETGVEKLVALREARGVDRRRQHRARRDARDERAPRGT